MGYMISLKLSLKVRGNPTVKRFSCTINLKTSIPAFLDHMKQNRRHNAF